MTNFAGLLRNFFFSLLCSGRIIMLLSWIRILVPYCGLGCFYLFVAIFVVGSDTAAIIISCILGSIGVIYCVCGCKGEDRGVKLGDLQNVGDNDSITNPVKNVAGISTNIITN
jgi:hypothetical protein